jgi:hypothetical protein
MPDSFHDFISEMEEKYGVLDGEGHLVDEVWYGGYSSYEFSAKNFAAFGGKVQRSIELNAARFNLSPQLVRILENTIELVDK